jgi:hypothetical protein
MKKDEHINQTNIDLINERLLKLGGAVPIFSIVILAVHWLKPHADILAMLMTQFSVRRRMSTSEHQRNTGGVEKNGFIGIAGSAIKYTRRTNQLGLNMAVNLKVCWLLAAA